MRTAGLRLEQAPPLSVPLAFFLTAPLAVAAAGGVLVATGGAALASGWAPLTAGLTHLGTLGFLTMVMMGALYQMIPVVAGSPVPHLRLAHAVHAALVLTTAALGWGLARVGPGATLAAYGAGSLAVLLFVVPVGLALARAPVRSETVSGMRLALACFLLVAYAGLSMSHGYQGLRFPQPRALWLQVHLSLALLGWVGGLVTAVSWQVLPMFYLAEEVAPAHQRALRRMLAAGVALCVLALSLAAFGALPSTPGLAAHLAALGALPAALAVWGLHPLLCLRSLRRRRRARADASLLFWRAGLLGGLATGAAAAAAHLLPDPRAGLLFGWLALWGWAGMIVHGMLTRIVPFLVWFHRFAPLVGHAPVPSLRGLLPDAWARLGFALHAATLAAGVVASLGAGDAWARLAGLGLLATAANLGRCLVHAARQRPLRAAPARAAAAAPTAC